MERVCAGIVFMNVFVKEGIYCRRLVIVVGSSQDTFPDESAGSIMKSE